jgi:rare lipoprotein A
MKASWYGMPFHGRTMANGQKYNMYDPLTVAHKSWPFGTKILVTNTANGRTCRAIVRDRGPYVAGRSLDFSKAAADCLGFTHSGTATVKVRFVQ